MKKIVIMLLTCAFLFAPHCVHAENGKVTYSGDAGEFIFEPGSEYSPTDLFPNFKDVMPGDVLTQKIKVKNEASKKVKVKIYMRSLGAHEDSKEFLSQLGLTVQKSEDNAMAYMFNATADATAQLTDWVCLGTLYSGGEVNLDVTLNVPVTLDNQFKKLVGYLDWEFKIEEFPSDRNDPKPPDSGDTTNLMFWVGMFMCSMFFILILLKKRKEPEESEG